MASSSAPAAVILHPALHCSQADFLSTDTIARTPLVLFTTPISSIPETLI
jgi:hypothetical protein